MTRFLLSAALLAALSAAPAAAAEPTPPLPADDAAPMMAIDRDSFIEKAGGSNDWEIRSSELSKTKAAADGVKELAHMLIVDHVAAAVKLKTMLKSKADRPETLPRPVLAPKYALMLRQLQAVNGAEFDALYLDMQLEAHMEAIALFRTYAGSGKDQALVGFARDTLPTLENHLGHVKQLIARQ